jgi:uncharacterized membrane protein (UPF0127 family)
VRGLLVAVLVLAACGDAAGPDGAPQEGEVLVESGPESYRIEVEIAATGEARRRGLMGRSWLPPDRGMLFLYPEEAPREFWMKDCLVTIDAAFLAPDGRILGIEEMVPEPDAGRPRSYPSPRPVRMVLEMPGGWFRDHGVVPGDRVVLPEVLRRIRAR